MTTLTAAAPAFDRRVLVADEVSNDGVYPR
jgi:hypothetical protein